MVMMRERDAQANDVPPGNVGVLRAEVLAEGVRRLADDLQKALHRELPNPVLLPSLPANTDDVADLTGGIQDVSKALVVPSAHRSTDSARIARSRLFSPPAETMSTARPSSSSSSRDMRIRSKRELSWSKSTRKSMSLSGLSSPRAAEPKGGPCWRGDEPRSPSPARAWTPPGHATARTFDQPTSHLAVLIPRRIRDNNGLRAYAVSHAHGRRMSSMTLITPLGRASDAWLIRREATTSRYGSRSAADKAAPRHGPSARRAPACTRRCRSRVQ